MTTRFILRLRLSTEHHYMPCLKRVELPLNEQIVNTIGITSLLLKRLSYMGCFVLILPLRLALNKFMLSESPKITYLRLNLNDIVYHLS
ncbi:hypothetical protein C9I43_03175 [Shewanella morhuae]|uniref:Uncharacterized protein n=1 Tax=Shewanella morhuae TaxID=365591 RepID=A0ABX5HRV0_9GAMM|nr:hypothetical protein C9I43_03175 [Shewanella morhuae]